MLPMLYEFKVLARELYVSDCSFLKGEHFHAKPDKVLLFLERAGLVERLRQVDSSSRVTPIDPSAYSGATS